MPGMRSTAATKCRIGRRRASAVERNLSIHVFDDVFDLHAGETLSLDLNLQHDVEAITDSTALVSIAWPVDSRLVQPRKVQHGGY